jgi:pleiotropic regulator 1
VNSVGGNDTQEQTENALVPFPNSGAIVPIQQNNPVAIMPRKTSAMPRPKWHPPWKLYRVISGHLGWVRCVTVEPGNEWFATGSADRVIKVSLC